MKKKLTTMRSRTNTRLPRQPIKTKSGWLLNMLIGLLPGLCISLIVLMMTACASSTMQPAASPLTPANLMQPCPKLPPLESKTGAAITKYAVTAGTMYVDCSDGKDALINAVKK